MTTKSYPAKAPTVPKLMAIAVTGADRVPDMLYGLDSQGRVWHADIDDLKSTKGAGVWRPVRDDFRVEHGMVHDEPPAED